MACIIRGPGEGNANSGGNMDRLYSMVGPNSSEIFLKKLVLAHISLVSF